MAAQRPFFVTTSWDDGTVQDLRLADLLSKYSVPATFYVAKCHPYGSLQESQIKELAQSFELGAHTLNHVALNSVSDALADNEIANSKIWIEQLSGRRCQVFCFPQGNFSSRHVHMVRKAGFYGARTVELMSSTTASLVSGVAIMPTTIQAFPHKRSAYLRNILRRHSVSNLVTYLHSQGKDWTTTAASLLTLISSHGGLFHLWGHAWEIDQFDLWRDLEQVLQTLEQYKSVATFVYNSEVCAGVLG